MFPVFISVNHFMLYYFQLDPKRIRWLDNEKRLVIRRRYLSFTNDDGSVVKVSVPLEWLVTGGKNGLVVIRI